MGWPALHVTCTLPNTSPVLQPTCNPSLMCTVVTPVLACTHPASRSHRLHPLVGSIDATSMLLLVSLQQEQCRSSDPAVSATLQSRCWCCPGKQCAAQSLCCTRCCTHSMPMRRPTLCSKRSSTTNGSIPQRQLCSSSPVQECLLLGCWQQAAALPSNALHQSSRCSSDKGASE